MFENVNTITDRRTQLKSHPINSLRALGCGDLKTEESETACWVPREILKTEGIACQFPREILKTEGRSCEVPREMLKTEGTTCGFQGKC